MQRLKELERILAQWERLPLSAFTPWLNGQQGDTYEEARARWLAKPNCFTFGRWLYDIVRQRRAVVSVFLELQRPPPPPVAAVPAPAPLADLPKLQAMPKQKRKRTRTRAAPGTVTVDRHLERWPAPPPPLKSLPPITPGMEFLPGIGRKL